MFKLTLYRTIAATALLAAACLGSGGPAAAQEINAGGATFPYPIYAKWFQAFHQAHPGITINYQPVGSGAGIAQYKAGTFFFAGSDAPLSNQEQAEMPQSTIHIPTVAGTEVLAYNLPGIGPGLKLTGPVIADIYLGTIKSWNDPRIQSLNPGLKLPAEGIVVVHRSDGSGTTYIFTHYLSAVSPEWRTKVSSGKSVNWPVGLGGPGNQGVTALVMRSRGGIGYVELAYALQNHLTYGPVRNKAGEWVEASIESGSAAAAAGVAKMKKDVRVSVVDGPGKGAYPITGFTYLLVPKQPRDPAKGRAMLEFIRWAMGPGQAMAKGLLYSPLPHDVVALNDKALSQVAASR